MTTTNTSSTTSAKGRYGMGNLCEHRQISATCDRCAVISLVKMNAALHKRIADATSPEGVARAMFHLEAIDYPQEDLIRIAIKAALGGIE